MAPCCAPTAPDISEASQQEAVAACLERLKPGHFQAKRLAFEIRDVGFTPAGSLATLQLLVRWIYERAVSDPERFAAPCAALCFSLTPILPTFKCPGTVTTSAKAKRTDVRQTLLNLCQREFEAAYRQTASATGTVDAGAEKPIGSLVGSLQFLAYLYLHNLLTDRIMLSCLLKVTSGSQSEGGCADFHGSSGQQRLECLVKGLLVAGRQLDERLAQQFRSLLDGLYEQLRALHTGRGGAEGLPPELQSSLSRLLELRAEGWASAAAASPASQSSSPGAPAAANGLSAAANGAALKLRPPRPLSLGGATGPASSRASGGSVVGAALPLGATAAARRAAAAAAAAPSTGGQGSGSRTPLSRRSSSSGSIAGLGMKSRGSCQNLEGLWDLSMETYNDVRGQLLSQPVADSPATLEALADELVESAVAASGGDVDCLCWSGAAQQRGFPSSAALGAVPPPDSLTDEEWAQQVQQQWEEQLRVSDMYVRLCADALQQMSVCSPGASPAAGAEGALGAGTADLGPASPAGCNGCCSPSSAAPAGTVPSPSSAGAAAAPVAGTVSDTGRAFRRHLLSSAQAHFERALSALLPAAPARSPSPPPSHQQPPAGAPPGQQCVGDGDGPCGAGPAASAEVTPRGGASARTGGGAGEERRAWGDMPEALPDAASALPRARGVCHLLLGLLRHGMLTPRIVLGAAAALVDGAAAGSDGCLQCACILLAGLGKQVATFKMAEAAAFESLVKRLQGIPGAQGGDGQVQLQRRFVRWMEGSQR